MENIKEYLQRIQSVTPRKSRITEYSEIVQKFLDELNPSRVLKGLPPVTYPIMGFHLKRARMSLKSLYPFYEECRRAKNFSAYFWWYLKERKNQGTTGKLL